MAGTLTISGLSAGLVSGQKTIGPVTMTGNVVIGEIIDAALASGDNTFSVPTGATAVAIFLGANPTVSVALRTNLNVLATGMPVSGSGFVVIPLATGVTELILNASASITAIELSFI